MDPMLVCKKTRRLKGKLADICRKEPSLLKEIAKGVQVGTRECQYQFRNRRWNCTTVRRSLKKILLRGKPYRDAQIDDNFRNKYWDQIIFISVNLLFDTSILHNRLYTFNSLF